MTGVRPRTAHPRRTVIPATIAVPREILLSCALAAGAPGRAASKQSRSSPGRLYFADEPEANAADPVIARVPVERRATLLAEPVLRGLIRAPGK
jgi:protocatechuate 3,4-dioxygenase beta subunit